MTSIIQGIGIALLVALVFVIGWAVTAALAAFFLNVIGGFGLSFAQVVGLGGLISVITTGLQSSVRSD